MPTGAAAPDWVLLSVERRVTLEEVKAADEARNWSRPTRRRHQRGFESGFCSAAVVSRIDRERAEPCGSYRDELISFPGWKTVWTGSRCAVHATEEQDQGKRVAMDAEAERRRVERETRAAAKAQRLAKREVDQRRLSDHQAEMYLRNVLVALVAKLQPHLDDSVVCDMLVTDGFKAGFVVA